MNEEELLKEIREEIAHAEIRGIWKANYKEGFNDGIATACDIITKRINELVH